MRLPTHSPGESVDSLPPSLTQNARPVSSRSSERVQRTLDIAFACLFLLVSAPLMLLVAIVILVESGRPVFFAQVRLGQHGRPFRMLKFRKFHKTESTDGLPLTRIGDQRMTKVGHILYATKLDELPQLWNVLRGEMAVVGPRPESVAFADCFQGWVTHVLDHKPGILGPSQAAFRDESALFTNEADPTIFYRDMLLPAKARIDLAYYTSRTLRSDLRWMGVGVLATFRCAPAFVDRQCSWRPERKAAGFGAAETPPQAQQAAAGP